MFGEILDEQYERVGPRMLTEWVKNCVANYGDVRNAITPDAFRTFKPQAAERFNDNTECKFCRDNKWFDPGNGRLIKCHCPPEARVKYEGYKTAPVNVTMEIKKLKNAVNMDQLPSEPDKSLGFWVDKRGDDWELHDMSMPNGFRKANTFEVIMWRALKFWKGAYFEFKQRKEKTA